MPNSPERVGRHAIRVSKSSAPDSLLDTRRQCSRSCTVPEISLPQARPAPFLLKLIARENLSAPSETRIVRKLTVRKPP